MGDHETLGITLIPRGRRVDKAHRLARVKFDPGFFRSGKTIFILQNSTLPKNHLSTRTLEVRVSDEYGQVAQGVQAFLDGTVHSTRGNNQHGPRLDSDLLLPNTGESSSLNIEDSLFNGVRVRRNKSSDLNIPNRERMSRLGFGQIPSSEVSNPLGHNLGKMLYDRF